MPSKTEIMKKQPLEQRTPAIIIAPFDSHDDELIHNAQDIQVTAHITHTKQHADLILKSHR